MIFLFFFISFFSSIIGVICGMGGGIIIKPVMDMSGMASVSAISFLSACTVLTMSCYSVSKSIINGEKELDLKVATPLAVGSALGGIIGKQLFSIIKLLFSDGDSIGAVQSFCLLLLTMGTLFYTLKKNSIQTMQIKNAVACLIVGLTLGILSSFLGIGGGPFNLIMLYYCFSMNTKTASRNSLYIVLFSQAASLVTTLVTRSVPVFPIQWLLGMVAGGLGGGIIGQTVYQRIEDKMVEKIFIGVIVIIIGICIYNTVRFTLGAGL